MKKLVLINQTQFIQTIQQKESSQEHCLHLTFQNVCQINNNNMLKS